MIRTAWTLGALRTARAARAEWQRLQAQPNVPEQTPTTAETTLVLSHSTFAGTGLTPGESWLATTTHREHTRPEAEGDDRP